MAKIADLMSEYEMTELDVITAWVVDQLGETGTQDPDFDIEDEVAGVEFLHGVEWKIAGFEIELVGGRKFRFRSEEVK